MSGNYNIDLDKGSRKLGAHKVVQSDQIKPATRRVAGNATFSEFTARRAERKAKRKAARLRRR